MWSRRNCAKMFCKNYLQKCTCSCKNYVHLQRILQLRSHFAVAFAVCMCFASLFCRSNCITTDM